uniref:Pyroglutamyl-peptidase 1 n=1 Tax=Lygus hesperus TaxID=30085 RepID=A0A146LXZ4_LYGHE
MAQACERPAVILTGFGPFGDHKTNDSWTSVCKVAQGDRGRELEERLNVRFILKEMPVCYEFADVTVPQLWAEHCPLFVLHVGIHKDDLFRIETQSRRTNYHVMDVEGRMPTDCLCKAGQCDVVTSTLNVEKLLDDVKNFLAQRKTDVRIALSDDPGNYLCGYTYYTSLCADAGRSLFLHIPPPSSTIPVSFKADVVEAVLVHSLQQVRATCAADA